MSLSPTYFYEPKAGHGLAHDPFGSIIAPRPIGWISSVSGLGVHNLAPYSFFNAFSYHPPLIGFSSMGYKDSVRNIEQTGEFCWSLVTKSLAPQMDISSAMVSADVDEYELAKLEKRNGKIVSVPFVAASPVSMECKLTDIVQLKGADGQLCEAWLVMGEVVGVHIANDFLIDGVYKTERAEPVLRGGGLGDYFSIAEAQKFEMLRPTIK